uniref:Uncharacterized protein n=1 Tax=Anguilla anguilla TaxID=7936 RepID=A0A0E9Q8W5_ANGAN
MWFDCVVIFVRQFKAELSLGAHILVDISNVYLLTLNKLLFRKQVYLAKIFQGKFEVEVMNVYLLLLS